MTIEVDVYGKDMEITDRVDEYVAEKTAKLDRYLPGIDEARVDLHYSKTARNAQDRYQQKSYLG